MDEEILTFLGVTGTTDEAVARQYLEMTGGDLEYAVTLFMESQPTLGANDAQIAEQLQEEAYQVREADALVHRHDTLVDYGFSGGAPGMFSGMTGAAAGPQSMFGQGRVGIFNQRMDDDENEYYRSRFGTLSEALDLDLDVVEVSHTLTQQRLAQLFRPPFDIITVALLDEAKALGKQEKKWILINIQDPLVFQSQVMNRDFWSNKQVKEVVKENFIFLQYQRDLVNGENYVNFYHIDECPHVAILDSWTGERVRKWDDGQVPNIDQWLEDIDGFLTEFSLNPESQNPVVTHKPKFDPNALTEEQQIELAMKQLMQGSSKDTAIALDDADDVEPHTPSGTAGATTSTSTTTNTAPQDPFDAITPQDHEEPADGFRMQIRFPNGKRVVHKFGELEPVRAIFAWLKHIIATDDYGVASGERFMLTNQLNRGFSFIDNLDTSVADAGLKNASVLVEKE